MEQPRGQLEDNGRSSVSDSQPCNDPLSELR